jgi:REP element-mobilizing transposase RayT
MPRPEVIFQAGNYYHVYNRGNNRQLIFFERDNYIYFLRQLRTHLINRGVDIIAYCLMPNHYHLLVYLKTEHFSKLMQAFTLSYAKAINQRYNRVTVSGTVSGNSCGSRRIFIKSDSLYSLKSR